LSDADHLKQWSRESWRGYKALQQPEYPDKASGFLRFSYLKLQGRLVLSYTTLSGTQQRGGGKEPATPFLAFPLSSCL
jgi:hypothetical protein